MLIGCLLEFNTIEAVSEPVWFKRLVEAQFFMLVYFFVFTNPIFELELEKIIARNWFLAGHVSELAEPGDFKVLKVARESVIIVRGSDGAIKAFANVCRHRGSLVCLERRGNSRKFACPYHGWTFAAAGRCVDIPSSGPGAAIPSW